MTTKLHTAVETTGDTIRLRWLVLTAGQRGDAPQAPALLEGLEARHVIADAAYDSDAIRSQIERQGGRACIKPNPTRKRKKRYNCKRYKRRNRIERFFRAIKGCRRVATRYEKKAANYAALTWLAAGLAGMT
ncbi:MAG: transposase [Planctomycetota bacterium]